MPDPNGWYSIQEVIDQSDSDGGVIISIEVGSINSLDIEDDELSELWYEAEKTYQQLRSTYKDINEILDQNRDTAKPDTSKTHPALPPLASQDA